MKIKDLPVGTKYRQVYRDGVDLDLESTYIILNIEYSVGFGLLEDEEGLSYCINENRLVPWRGHQNFECEIVE